MPVTHVKAPAEVRNLIRHLPPVLKRKIRAALADILDNPTCGKALKEELEGYWSLRVGRTRIVYRLTTSNIEIVAIGRVKASMKKRREKCVETRRSDDFKRVNPEVRVRVSYAVERGFGVTHESLSTV